MPEGMGPENPTIAYDGPYSSMRSENKGAVVVPKDKVIPVETIVKLRGDFSRLPDEDRTRWEQAYGEVVRAMDTMTVGHEIQRVVRDVVEVSVEGGKTSVEEALAGLGNKAEVIAEQVQASVRGFVNSESGKNDSGLQVAWNDYGDLVPDYVKSQVERYGAVARQAWGRESGNTDELLIQSVAGEPEVNIGEVISDVNRDLGEKGVGSEVIEQGSGEPVVESVDLGGAATPTATSSHGDDEPGGADAGNAGGNSVGSEGEAAPKRWRVRLRVKDRPGRGGRRESAETQTEEKPVERTRRLLREGLRLIGPEFENLTLAQVMGELERLAADPSVDLSSNPRINNLRRALNVFDGLLGNEQQLPIARTMATHRTSGNYVDVYNGVLEYDCEAGDLALARERVDLMENGQLMPELVGVSRLFRMGELDQLQLDLLVTLSSQTRGREMVEVLGSDSAYLVGMSRTERITFPHKMSTLRRRVTLLRWGTRVTNGRLVVGLVDELQAKLSKKDSDQVKPREATVMGVERMQETQRANLEAMFVGRVLGAEDISVLTNSVDVIVGKEFGDLAALVKALIHMGGDVNRWKNGGHEELAKVGYSDVLAFITQMNHEPSKLILRIVLEEAIGLRRRGYMVEVYAPTLDEKMCFPDLIEKVKVKTFLPPLINKLPLKNALRMVSSSLLAPFFSLMFRDVDIFIGANQPGAWIAFCVSKILGRPYLVYLNQPNRIVYPRPVDVEFGWTTTVKDYQFLYKLFRLVKPALSFLDNLSIRNANAILVNGKYIGQVIENIYSRWTIDNPAGSYLHPLSPRLQRTGKYVLITNRHDPQKRFDYVIQAMDKVVREVPGAKLIIPGPFTKHTHKLIRLTKHLGLEKNILFVGKISESKLQKLYKNAWVYCYPSPEEDFGLGPIEAGGWGVPTVAWNHAGPTVTVSDGETGFLAKPYDIDDYADKMIKLFKNKSLRNKMGKMAWKRTRDEFSWDKHIDMLEEEIKKLINK
jgi:glycosyltransferase involved in cell wall biosynthesis